MALGKMFGVGLLGILGCASVDHTIKAADHPLGVECSETECILPRSKDLVSGFEWVYHSPDIEVMEAKQFPGSDKTVVYVADSHFPEHREKVMGVLSEFKYHHFQGIIGLEGMTGNLSASSEQTRERYEQYNQAWKEAGDRRKKYTFITSDEILSLELLPSKFLDHGQNGYELRAPGVPYSFPIVQLFGNQAVVMGVEDKMLYASAALSAMKDEFQPAIDLVSCFYQLHSDDFASCSAFLDQSYVPESKRDCSFLDRYRKIRDKKELLAEMLSGMQQSYACLEQIPMPTVDLPVNSAVDREEMNNYRSRNAVMYLQKAMDDYHQNNGILIFGRDHEQDIITGLSINHISYLSIQVTWRKP